jgi:hypothetical protein
MVGKTDSDGVSCIQLVYFTVHFKGAPWLLTRVSQKVKGPFKKKKKHIYCEYTETKPILIFNVIPHDFNAPVTVFHTFF